VLSEKTSHRVLIEALYEGEDFDYTLTRAALEQVLSLCRW
jgi:hypothetical protein